MNFKKYYLLLIVVTLFSSCGIRKKHDTYNLKKLNSEERRKIITENIDTLEGSDLGNYIYHIDKSNVNLNKYDNSLRKKLDNAIYPYDIYLLSSELLNNKENIYFVQNILNAKIQKWDVGNWGNKFWNLINAKKLIVNKPFYYEFNNGSKEYNFDKFLNSKIKNDELGLNPVLFLNDILTDYKEGTLNLLLKKYDIIQIDYIPKKRSVGLFGKRGVDGKISVITK